MKVLICGNEKFSDREIIFNEIGRLDMERGPFTTIMQFGGCGPEAQARNWAWENGADEVIERGFGRAKRSRSLLTFHHDWDKWGPGAHHKTYSHVLQQHRPDLIIAFGSERGPHRALVRLASVLGIEIIEFAFADLSRLQRA